MKTKLLSSIYSNPIRVISVVFLLILLLASKNAYSQSNFGITTGLNLTGIHLDRFSNGSNDPTNILRYHAGIYVEIPLGNRFAIEPRLLYSLKGWHFKSFTASEDGGSMNLHYIDFQLLGKYLALKKTSCFVGFEVGRRMKTVRKPSLGNFLFADRYEKLNLGLILGMEYELIPRLNLNLKYIYGIRHLDEFTLTDFQGNEGEVIKDFYHRTIQLGASFRLLGKARESLL